MIVIVDHIRGINRGCRLRFEEPQSIRFGRHPDNDVSFDGKRDIDASAHHAQLERDAETGVYVLRDLGSSNGTWIAGEKTAERELITREILEVEFGRGGPKVKLWLGRVGDTLPTAPQRPPWWRRFLRR